MSGWSRHLDPDERAIRRQWRNAFAVWAVTLGMVVAGVGALILLWATLLALDVRVVPWD